ncbi:Nramp family divalent metal transporter [Nocardioides sp. YIM 152315]|uniref:Nramp family divalent metal transporter n=1 Tax=Nocardioides sp. YIM 152315 TaxID=3031760 RepID=UPI0023DA9D63|nr:Nramp family divalent metal transporter [Nocardioides sp. YIM 152315]MDF1605741.1 Nramp family divalent metal transporter [Nocardioides sp. YIM 152315]
MLVPPRVRRSQPTLPLLGPAFVTAIAYVDPGNFATNLSAGASYGYLLVWVVVASNLMAMLIQYLSAKAGIATGLSLPALCRVHLPRPAARALWVQAELVAIATDLAEVVGGAIALNLLFGTPLVVGGTITAVVAFALLGLKSRGHRPYEAAITGMLGVILVGFAYNVLLGAPEPADVAGGLVPRFDGAGSVLLAAGMLGATVMPHAIYLHSGLTTDRHPCRTDAQRQRLLRGQRVDVVVAMTLAGLMNLALLVIAASVLGGSGADTIEAAHAALGRVEGGGTALLFALALLASGFAASSVGTLSGQVVMEGFLRRRVPLVVRRLSSLAPAMLVLALGADPTQALVVSQVVLSFGIPFALVPLIAFTRRRDLMGTLVNRRATTVVASGAAAVIIALNLTLVVLTIA